MLKRMNAMVATLTVIGALCLSMAATPVMARKSGQGVRACASNLKCNDFVTDTGEHVMCVKGGGCVLCPADRQANCIVAMRLHTGQITTDPSKVLMDGSGSAAPVAPASGASGGSGHHNGTNGGGVILY